MCSGNFCEKYCCCSLCTTKLCLCYAVSCECDPNLCTKCGLVDFRNLTDELITKCLCSCHSLAIQHSLHKQLLLAKSDVARWGIFKQVNIQPNDFIVEKL